MSKKSDTPLVLTLVFMFVILPWILGYLAMGGTR
jgi:hypothetical protein